MKYLLAALSLAAGACASPTSPAAVPPPIIATEPGTPPPGAQCAEATPDDPRVAHQASMSVTAITRMTALSMLGADQDVAPVAGPWAIELVDGPPNAMLTAELFLLPKPGVTLTLAELDNPPWPVFLTTTVVVPPRRGTGVARTMLCWTGHAGDSYGIRLRIPSGGGATTILVRQPR